MRKWTATLLALLLVMGMNAACLAEAAQSSASPAPTLKPYGEALDGSIRVYLQSLGSLQAAGMTLEGVFSVGGDRGFQFEKGTEIALGINGGSIVLKAGGAIIDMGGGFTLVRHQESDGSLGGVLIHEGEINRLYRGDLSFDVYNETLRIVVKMDIEEYLYGVVPYEMHEDFPLEALKAQSVAARTYAMMRKVRKTADVYDVVDTPNDQVYKGFDARYILPIRAVDETRGIVGMYSGQYAECLYSASNGGQTALASDVWGGEAPYFDIRDDPYDLANTESIVKTATVPKGSTELPGTLSTVLGEALTEKLVAEGKLGEGDAAQVTEVIKAEATAPVYGGDSRQYGTIRFEVKASIRTLEGDANDLFKMLGEAKSYDKNVTLELSYYDQVRQALNISINSSKYDMITVEDTANGFLFTARRYGHGVGLSQRGAQEMAGKHEKTYLDILKFYYPGLDLVRLTWKDTTYTKVDALPDSLGYAAPRPTPVPTAAPLPALQAGEYYAVVTVEGIDGTLNVRSGPSTEDDKIGVLRNSARLIVTEDLGEWVKFKTVEMEGYVMKSFLQKEE